MNKKERSAFLSFYIQNKLEKYIIPLWVLTYINWMVPNGRYCDSWVKRPDEQIQNEKQEITHVFKTLTIVDPRAMMVHHEYASVANRTMMCSSRLYFFTTIPAVILPFSAQFLDRFRAVLEYLFYWRWNAFEAIRVSTLSTTWRLLALIVIHINKFFSRSSLLYFVSNFLNPNEIWRTTCFNPTCHGMIEKHLVANNYTNGSPNEPKLKSKSFLKYSHDSIY